MAIDLGDELQGCLSKIEAVFVAGRLGDRSGEMRQLRQSGDTLLFSGGVKWSVMLPDFDMRLKGESESLDAAFGDMTHCLSFLATDHGEDAQVICAVEGENA